jgi:hypothetical protein
MVNIQRVQLTAETDFAWQTAHIIFEFVDMFKPRKHVAEFVMDEYDSNNEQQTQTQTNYLGTRRGLHFLGFG